MPEPTTTAEPTMPTMHVVRRHTSLESRVGIVTGQSGGLGVAISRVLAAAGATVYGFNRTVRPEAVMPGVTQVQVDITDETATARAVREIGDARGIDFLVNNAGVTHKARAESVGTADWRGVQEANVDAAFRLCREAYPFLTNSRTVGRIVTIGSMASHLGFAEVVPYAASKAAVGGMTRGLAVEWARDNILVNTISPGWFPSAMNRSVLTNDPERERRILSRIPLGHYGDPEAIGDMTLFLVSDAARYITGQDFAVDGGTLAQGF